MKRSVVLGALLLFLLSGLFVRVQEWRQDEPNNIGTPDGSAVPDESPVRQTNAVTSSQGIVSGESQTSQAVGIPRSAECEGFALPGEFCPDRSVAHLTLFPGGPWQMPPHPEARN